MDDVFHGGEQAMQSRAGVRERMAAQGSRTIRDFMPEQHRSFFPLLPYLPVAVRDAEGWPVGTILSGRPGFVSGPDPRLLQVDALPAADDPAAAGLTAGAPVGILGIDLSTRRRNRVNGHVAERTPEGFTVAVEQSFGNCPQYIQRREPVEHAAKPGPVQRLAALDATARALIAGSDTVFVASGAERAGLDMSHRGGRPGFVRLTGDRLTVPDFAGNHYFNTLGNFSVDPRAALLFVDFVSGDLLVVGGEVEIEWSGQELAAFAGAERLWRVRVTRAWRLPGALPLRWSFQGYAPALERTGRWASG
jgi:hypothetical protein